MKRQIDEPLPEEGCGLHRRKLPLIARIKRFYYACLCKLRNIRK